MKSGVEFCLTSNRVDFLTALYFACIQSPLFRRFWIVIRLLIAALIVLVGVGHIFRRKITVKAVFPDGKVLVTINRNGEVANLSIHGRVDLSKEFCVDFLRFVRATGGGFCHVPSGSRLLRVMLRLDCQAVIEKRPSEFFILGELMLDKILRMNNLTLLKI